MKRKSVLLTLLLTIASLSSMTSCGNTAGKDEYDSSGKLILNLRNLYFNDWTGGDTYTEFIQEKFNVAIQPSAYSWADWDSQVYGPVNANNLTDVFHFNLDSYNFANSYVDWAQGKVIKPLPKDMSKWPNVKKIIDEASNSENLYIDGNIYCIPVIKNLKGSSTEYSPFTYVYRRDWAKEYGVYQEGDVYNWEQFQALLKAFYDKKCSDGTFYALADVEWGYPSIINFYKDAPHCFATDANGKVVSNYTTDGFLEGLDLAKKWSSGTQKIYGYAQYSANNGDISKAFYGGRVGVFYENLSLANYTKLREQVADRPEIKNAKNKKELIDDFTAIMKVSGPDGKYALEGTENWFSATFFSYDISDEKQAKILDVMDWLLSEEGTLMALYGKEGYDYTIDENKNVTLLEAGWEKDMDGNYVEKFNGAKYLRYMATLGYDTNKDDPLVDKDSLKILDDWYAFMDARKAEGNLRVLEENGKVKWLATPTKSAKAGSLLSDGTTSVIQYCYDTIKTTDEYKAKFTTSTWNTVLDEINQKLGK